MSDHPALAFLRTLLGPDDEPQVFQVFKDYDASNVEPRHKQGTFAEMVERLQSLNTRGAGIYVTINHSKNGGRTAEDIDAVRCLMVDGDDIAQPDFFPCTPTLLQQRLSDDHRWQAFWRLVPGEDPQRWSNAQKALAAHYGSDPSVHDLSRVMRLPGFLHQKDPANPTYYVIKETAPLALYTIDQVLIAHGIDPASVTAQEPPAPLPPAAYTDLPYHVELCQAALSVQDGAVEGNNGDQDTVAAARFGHDYNLSPETLWPLLVEWNETCVPVWPIDELQTKMRNAYRYAKLPAGWRTPEACFVPIPPPPVDPGAPQPACARPWRDVLKAHPKLREPLIDGLLRRGEVMNLVAAPKCGKSWLALSLAFAMASGVPWLGHTVTKGVTLYVDNELHPETWASRAWLVASLHPDADGVHLMALRGQVKGLDLMAQAIVEEATRVKADVIVLDAFYRFLPKGVSENDNAAMTQLSNAVDRITTATGAAVVLIHHTSKGAQGDKAVTDVGAGASALARAADTHVALREHETENRVVFDAVTRSWPAGDSFVIERKGGLWTRVEGADASKLKGKIAAPAAPLLTADVVTLDMVAELVPQKPESRGAILTHAQTRKLRIPPEVMKVRLDQLVEAGRAVRVMGANNVPMWGREVDPAKVGTYSDQVARYLLEHPSALTADVARAVGCTERMVRNVRNTPVEGGKAPGKAPGKVNGNAEKPK